LGVAFATPVLKALGNRMGHFGHQKTKDRVEFDELSVTHFRADGEVEILSWDDLHEVGIVTTDEGPLSEDVFFVLLAADRATGCVIPQFSEGSQELLSRLQELKGFDSEAVITAMSTTSNSKFVCWEKSAT